MVRMRNTSDSHRVRPGCRNRPDNRADDGEGDEPVEHGESPRVLGRIGQTWQSDLRLGRRNKVGLDYPFPRDPCKGHDRARGKWAFTQACTGLVSQLPGWLTFVEQSPWT